MIYHIPAIKRRSGEDAALNFVRRSDSEEYLQLFKSASWFLFSLYDPKSPKYEYLKPTLLKSPPMNAHLEISNVILQGTHAACLWLQGCMMEAGCTTLMFTSCSREVRQPSFQRLNAWVVKSLHRVESILLKCFKTIQQMTEKEKKNLRGLRSV